MAIMMMELICIPHWSSITRSLQIFAAGTAMCWLTRRVPSLIFLKLYYGLEARELWHFLQIGFEF